MEKVILVDENDKETGVEEKIKAHKDGKLHRAFSIFVFNSKGELLLQKRAKEKYHFIYKVKVNDLFEHEYDHVFIGKLDQDPRPNPQEVEDYQWIDQEKLKKDILANPDKYTYWFKASANKVINAAIKNFCNF